MRNNQGLVVKDVVFVASLIAIVCLSIFVGWYFVNYTMRIEGVRNVAQDVEQTANGYYRNYLLMPDAYGEVFFDLSNHNTDLSTRITGRKPDGGEVFIRPINDMIGEISLAVYYDGFCATKYHRESKFDVRQTKVEECILDEGELGISKKEYSETLDGVQKNNN